MSSIAPGASVTERAIQELEKTQDSGDFNGRSFESSTEEKRLEFWIGAVKESQGQICLRFESGGGAHFITAQSQELVAIYHGPHGAENRPLPIREAAIRELANETSLTVCSIQETELPNSAVADLLKIES